LNINIDEVYHFEVYETKDNVKVNIIYDFYKNDIAFLSENNLEHFVPSVEAFNAYFKKTPKYFGLDKKGNLSFYYSFTE
jgi:quinol monooxygenase YgiN